MIIIEPECADCGKPCVEYCRYRHVPHFYCDACGEERQTYYFDGEELCLDCIEQRLEKVTAE